jgi:predicted dehydrogenase
MTTSKKLRVGLVGTGFGTNVHLPAFKLLDDRIDVVAVCSANLERARQAAERFGVPYFTDDYRDLVARPDVDLVDICTPPAVHHDITLAAIDNGKHVLCEKPLALDASQAQRMYERASAQGVVHAVNHEMRYLPARRHIRDLLAAGFIGKLQLVAAKVLTDHGTNPSTEPYYWTWIAQHAQGGGFLMGSLSHHIDLAQYCFGEILDAQGGIATLITERPVLAFDYRDGDPIGPDSPTIGMRTVDADDTAVMTGRFASGGMLTMSGSWSLRHPSGITMEVHGDRGMVRLDADGRLFGTCEDAPRLQELVPTERLIDVPGYHALVPPFVALASELAGVVLGTSAVQPNFATFDDGLRLQRILDKLRTGTRLGDTAGSA